MGEPTKILPEKISIGGYILERLTQLQVTALFGLPGDFNLAFLDLVEDNPGIQWVGNANELNAAYAADGNARVKRAVSAVCTTFGVGELSALNGVAGCYSERIPILHLVGVPGLSLQKDRAMLHHTLGDGGKVFKEMSSHITCMAASLDSKDNAAERIDEVLTAMLTECRPVYLMLPTNLVLVEIPAERLKVPLPPSVSSPHPLLVPSSDLPTDLQPVKKFSAKEEEVAHAQYAAVRAITSLFAQAKNPIILLDALAERLGAEELVVELAEKTGMKVFVSPMGKSTVWESHPLFSGIYAGSVTVPSVAAQVEAADLVFDVGPLKSDFNTGSFSYGIKCENTVEIRIDRTVVGYAEFPNAGLRSLLPQLITAFSDHFSKNPKAISQEIRSSGGRTEEPSLVAEQSADEITHEYLWKRVSKFFKEGDVIVAETGTSSFGILDSRLPKGATLISQVLWGSIGWSVGACLGAALAAREQKRRTILFVGEGSLQLTVQEIGTMIRLGLNPILFVINNDGYEIERQIHGPERLYNNISRWNHQLLLSSLSPPEDANNYPSNALPVEVERLRTHRSYRVSNRKSLEKLLTDEGFASAPYIQLVELVMPRGDAPRALAKQAKMSAKVNETA
ncbi:pyruvate Decarboyxlase [Cantharellus anzutake]|uniref:pyruvate Decarboyxlase n=1 Tax=Cantharellus anzutake TaxID=1750568 RepID=UPI001905A70F|nr:pyruvate Decarboyxlase [Cantharellus anzutake]KAF8334667.1 pyruvate Decarboyxlase [Cantharellus anzutake]